MEEFTNEKLRNFITLNGISKYNILKFYMVIY